MPLIHKHKLVFQHIPKTAGLSICNFFEVTGDGHQHIQWYHKVLDQQNQGWDEWRAFTVVRDPIDRFLSAWKMYNRIPVGQENNDSIFRLKNKCPELFSLSIDEFINYEILHKLGCDEDAFHFWPVTNYYQSGNPKTLEKTNLCPHYVLKFEQLHSDMSSLSNIIGFDYNKLPHKNYSPAEQLKISAESEKKLEHYFAEDYSLLNRFIDEAHVGLLCR